jgi:hypothetical protein
VQRVVNEQGDVERWESPMHYEIRVRGVLDERWSSWFDGMQISANESGDTTISGPVADQPALHGLLNKIRDLGLQLISVRPTEQ